VVADEGACHLRLQLLLVRIVGSLNLCLLLITILLAQRTTALGFASATRPLALLFVLDSLVHAPPFAKVGEPDLVGKLDGIEEGVGGGRWRAATILTGNIAIDVGRRGSLAAVSTVVSVPAADVVVSLAVSLRFVSINATGGGAGSASLSVGALETCRSGCKLGEK
jgi:hypothetical protein